MKNVIGLVLLGIVLAGQSVAKDKSNDYQMGTFVTATAASDGTITSTLHGDGTTVAGDVYQNQVRIYAIKVADGIWYVETKAQAGDSMLRQLGQTPIHFKSEKANPLDSLKNGDRVLFRLEQHRITQDHEKSQSSPLQDDSPNSPE